jgi:excinuclease ABC subunit C
MIHEVVARRLQHLINENEGLPDLLVIDGGATQLSRAVEAGRALGIEPPIISLAKRFEEIYVEPSRPPLRLPGSSPALSILKRLRDEAHRFAIGYHRKLRAAKAVSSVLDDVPRIGEKKKRLILSHLAEPSRIRDLSMEELSAIPGLGEKAARAVFEFFHPEFESTRS